MNAFEEISDQLYKLMCTYCDGHGVVDDAEPGDISFNTYDCPSCGGTGFKNGMYYKLEPLRLARLT